MAVQSWAGRPPVAIWVTVARPAVVCVPSATTRSAPQPRPVRNDQPLRHPDLRHRRRPQAPAPTAGLPLTRVRRRIVGRFDVVTQTTPFDGATVPVDAIAGLEAAMTNDPKDRPVLATAVASSGSGRHHDEISGTSPKPRRRRTGSRFCTPTSSDDFQRGSPDLAVSILTEQAAAVNRPPMTTHEVLDALTGTVPTFAAAIRSHVSGADAYCGEAQAGAPRTRRHAVIR